MRELLGENFAISLGSTILQNSGSTVRNVLLHDGTTVGIQNTNELVLKTEDTGLLNHAKFEAY